MGNAEEDAWATETRWRSIGDDRPSSCLRHEDKGLDALILALSHSSENVFFGVQARDQGFQKKQSVSLSKDLAIFVEYFDFYDVAMDPFIFQLNSYCSRETLYFLSFLSMAFLRRGSLGSTPGREERMLERTAGSSVSFFFDAPSL